MKVDREQSEDVHDHRVQREAKTRGEEVAKHDHFIKFRAGRALIRRWSSHVATIDHSPNDHPLQDFAGHVAIAQSSCGRRLHSRVGRHVSVRSRREGRTKTGNAKGSTRAEKSKRQKASKKGRRAHSEVSARPLPPGPFYSRGRASANTSAVGRAYFPKNTGMPLPPTVTR